MQGISLFHTLTPQSEAPRHQHTIPMMSAISHLIEDSIIEQQMQAQLTVGFQRFSNVVRQFDRYEKLGALCQQLSIIGVRDIAPPQVPGITWIELTPDSALAQEWFLLLNTPTCWTSLLALELQPDDSTTLPGQRLFDTFWSYDEQVAERAALLIAQLGGTPSQTIAKRDYTHQAQWVMTMKTRAERLYTAMQARTNPLKRVPPAGQT